jgi:hypothetical protein
MKSSEPYLVVLLDLLSSEELLTMIKPWKGITMLS